MIGADGPVGSAVGVDVWDGFGVETGFGVIFICHTSFAPTFLQIKVPDVEFSVVHLDPNLGVAA